MNSILLFEQKTHIRRVHDPTEKADFSDSSEDISEEIHIKPPHNTYIQEDRLFLL